MLISFCLLFFLTLFTIEIIKIFGIPYTNFIGEYKMERIKVFQSLNLVADLKKDRFLRWLKEVKNDSEAFAKNSVTTVNTAKLAELLGSGTSGGNSGHDVWNDVQNSEAGRALTEYIELIRGVYGIYSPIQIVDLQGGIIMVSTPPEHRGEVIENNSMITSALAESDYGILTTRHHGMEKYDFNLFRVIKYGDRAVGVLVIHIDIDDILKPMLRTGDGIGETGEALLVDSRARIITSLKYPLPDGTVPGPMELEMRGGPAVLAVGGKEGIISSEDYRNIPVLAAYRHLQITPDLGWGLVVKRDVEEIYAPFRRRIIQSAGITVLGMFFVSGLVLVITRSITGPILELSTAARKVEQGSFDVKARVTTSDEVGTLAKTFNMMVRRLRQWYTELEAQVVSRTAQLRSLNQELETKNAELERFTYTVSHDLKSPLITIHGFMGVMEKDMRDGNIERSIQDMEYIKNAAQKMQNLLDDLLELSRIGRLANPSEEIPVGDLAVEAVSLLKGPIEKGNVEIKILPDLPAVFVDRLRLVEVFQNLIENAVKFMDNQQRPRVEIGALQKNEEVLCYVRDNGIGIDPRYHEKIFSLFDKLNPRIEGTGVGLSLVRRIVEVHGGKIWVESEGLGEGSVFYFTLPRKNEVCENGT